MCALRYIQRVTPIRVELLGKLRFTFGQQLLTSINTNRLQSLLAFLVLHADAPQSREHRCSSGTSRAIMPTFCGLRKQQTILVSSLPTRLSLGTGK